MKVEYDSSKRFQPWLVVKGFQQKEGIDNIDIFAPIMKLNTIHIVLSIITSENLYLEQLDMNITFSCEDLEEDIYMYQLEGFLEKGKESLCAY